MRQSGRLSDMIHCLVVALACLGPVLGSQRATAAPRGQHVELRGDVLLHLPFDESLRAHLPTADIGLAPTPTAKMAECGQFATLDKAVPIVDLGPSGWPRSLDLSGRALAPWPGLGPADAVCWRLVLLSRRSARGEIIRGAGA